MASGGCGPLKAREGAALGGGDCGIRHAPQGEKQRWNSRGEGVAPVAHTRRQADARRGLRHWRPAVRSTGQCAGAQDEGHTPHGDCPRWRDHATQAWRTGWPSRQAGQLPIPKRPEARAERPVLGTPGREIQCRLRQYMRAQAWWQKRLRCSRRLRGLSEQRWCALWHYRPVPQLRARDTTLRLSVTLHVPE